MKLSVLLITGSSDRVALDTVQNIAGQSGDSVKEIFLIIAGEFTEEDRKKLYLERAAAFGMTAFINIGDKSEAELLNTFIKYANADFCTVMRAGGQIDPSYFERLTAQLEAYESLDIACGRRSSSATDPFTPSDIAKGIIELEKESRCFPETLEGTVMRTSFAAGRHFETEAGSYTEQKFLLGALCDSKRFWYDSGLNIMLAERKSTQQKTGELPDGALNAAYHTEIFEKCLLPLTAECKGRDGRLPMFMQHYYTHKVLECVRLGQLISEFPEEDRKIVIGTLTKTLKHVEDKVICDVYGILERCGRYCTEDKRLLLGIKHGHENFSPEISYNSERLFAVQKDIVFFDSTRLFISIEQLNVYKGCIEIDGSFDNIFNERRTKVTAEYGGKEYRLTYDRKGASVMFFGNRSERERTFHLSVPVEEERAELRFFILFKGCRYELKALFTAAGARVVNDSYDSFFPLGNGIFATAEGGRLITAPMEEKEQRRRFREFVGTAADYGVPFVMRNAYRFTRAWAKHRNIWIFADDTEKGGGAAEDMFRYAMTRHDELYCYYLTDKDSPAAARLTADGYKPLYSGTLLHKMLFLNAQVFITTKPDVVQNNYPDEAGDSFIRSSRMNTVFLQDTAEDKPCVEKNARLHDNVRLYFCGTGEYFNELKKPAYGYGNTEVLQLTGLTRYDDKKDISGEDKLLLISARCSPKEEAPFAETGFFKSCKELLENDKLKETLEKSGYTLTIAFEGVTNDEAASLPENDRVNVLTEDFDIDELKSRAALIVTNDASELSAGIMRKPLIYLGCERGHDFGELAENAEKLAEMLCEQLENGVGMKEELSRKADEYFGCAPLGTKREIYNTIITYLYENGEIDGYEDFEVADGYEDE